MQSWSYAQNAAANTTPNNNLLTNFKSLSVQQLMDTAEYYVNRKCNDTALICYRLIINTPERDNNIELQQLIIEAYNKIAVIYYYLCDYKSAYEFLIRALPLCEKIDYPLYHTKIYTNIGNIYSRFSKYDMAKFYYTKALDLCEDNVSKIVILNNFGHIYLEIEQPDSAFFFLKASLEMCKKHDNRYLYSVLNTMASLYQARNQYDSAFHFFQSALSETRKHKIIDHEAENLASLAKLFFKMKQPDSAIYYINMSNAIAEDNKFLKTLADNYLTLSQIEEAKGKITSAFAYYKKYAELRESVLNTEIFADINQLQRLYEVSKTNQQIEQLVIEQKIKERTIHYQKMIQFIILGTLLLMSVVLLFIFFQNRKLNKAYKILFEKNLEVVTLQDHSFEKHPEKYKRSALTNELHQELLNKILICMENNAHIYDVNFTIEDLAEQVQSNQSYVSQVINQALKKNFRSFINSFRIREAQRLFSDPDTTKYTIEAVALQVGFKSRNAFRETFKEITGVSPTFYLKSLKEQSEL